MDIFDVTGKIVKHFPKFIKRRMGKIVFLEPPEKLPKQRRNTNVVIVFGGGAGRIEHALNLYQNGTIDYILVTGGIGPYSENQEMAEAELYAEFLIKSGVPDNRIWIENESISTIENVKFSIPILIKESFKDINRQFNLILVTSGFHMKRVRALFKKALRRTRNSSPIAYSIFNHIYWSSSPCPKCERETWYKSERGCALVTKEAVRLISYRVLGKI